MMHWFDSTLSTDLSPLVESAFRSILLACLVAGGLKLLRVRNVVAQKAAWILVLGSAFAMPLLAPLALRMPISAANAFHISWKRAVTSMPATSPAPSTASVSTHAQVVKADRSQSATDTSLPYASLAPDAFESTRTMDLSSQLEAQPAQAHSHPPLTRAQFLFLLYCGVCATLLLRLIWGAALAIRLWRAGQPVALANKARFAHLSVRSSERISSPLTIGSGILLPAGFAEWDAEKLRIVLAHEASHVRQRDFYLQLAAGFYSAIFWFIPLGWWLKRKLSDLSEAISDRAGLGEAANPVSYAQILIHFAALPHNPQIGVAMARQGRLTQRIERLLNESSFSQAFTATRARMVVVLLCVPVALFTATALVRVQAAAQAPQTPAPAAVPAQIPPPPVDAPETAKAPQHTPPAAPLTANVPTIAPVSPAPKPSAPPAPSAAPAAPRMVTIPAIPAIKIHTQMPPIDINIPPMQAMKIQIPAVPQLPPQAILLQMENGAGFGEDRGKSNTTHNDNNATSYTHERNGEFYGLFERHGGSPRYTGSWTNGHIDAINQAEKLAKGDFLLYTNREGKSYYIDDPRSIAQMEALYASVNSFAGEKGNMARAQEQLAQAKAQAAERYNQAIITKPDLNKDLADLSAAIAKLEAQKESSITPQELADLQRKLGEMQGKLIQLQVNGRLVKMLNRELANTGQELGTWNAKEDALSRDTELRMKSTIDEAMKNGTAKPVQ